VPDRYPSVDVLYAQLRRLRLGGLLEQAATARKVVYETEKRPASRPEDIWALSTRGGREIGLATDFTRNNRRLTGHDPFSHALRISDFYTALVLADSHEAFEFRSWHGENESRFRSDVYYGGKFVRYTISPDGVFRLGSGAREREYYLEVERGTVPAKRRDAVGSSWLRRVLGYQDLWRKNRENPFTVTVVTETDSQLEALRETTIDADPKKRGNGIFYFTSFERWSLEQPEPFWSERIWTTASGERRRLFD